MGRMRLDARDGGIGLVRIRRYGRTGIMGRIGRIGRAVTVDLWLVVVPMVGPSSEVIWRAEIGDAA